MEIEFITSPSFNFLTSFGHQFHIPVHGNKLIIPAALGTGSIKKIDLDPDFKLLIHDYTLKEAFVIKRRPAAEPFDLISIICQDHDDWSGLSTRERQNELAQNADFSAQISSTQLDSIVRFPANTPIYFTVIGITSAKLRSVLKLTHPNFVVQTILNNIPGFLYYETLSIDELKVLRQLRYTSPESELSTLYYLIKVQELVYLVFEKLLRRTNSNYHLVNRTDMGILAQVRTRLLTDLSQPPQLKIVAKEVGMSETKLKNLFRQVFGDSIYAYYQKARLEEAAFLLKQGNHSIAEVGSTLGFVNLSHFSRLFKKQYGINPKKYTSGG